MNSSVSNDQTGASLSLFALQGVPLIQQGDDLSAIIHDLAVESGVGIKEGDVVVIAQKVVSKAEGAVVDLASVEPSLQAIDLAARTGRDPRMCELYIRESSEIIGVNGRMVITRHRLGFENTGAGIDRSNLGDDADEQVVLLPTDPDASAERIRRGLEQAAGCQVAVIISDSFGRPDRDGAIGVAIGISGIRHLEEEQRQDLYGNRRNIVVALIDELASAAAILMGETDEGKPVVIIRGTKYTRDENAKIAPLLIRFAEPGFYDKA